MATTARPRYTQPNETRVKPPFAGAVGDGRSLAKQATTMTLAQTPGMNAQGDNSTPVEAYRQPNPGQVQFAPGDPLRPIPGMGDRQGFPRQFPFPVGGNIQPQPRATETTSFEALRNLAAFYEGIQLCEQVHFRILSRLDLAFVPRPEVLGDGDDASSPKWVDGGRRIAEWFETPDKRQDLRAWMTAAYRDILEIDALGIFHVQNRGGGLHRLDLLAGDYLSCLSDGAARTPTAPDPAYMQVLYGVPAQLFNVDELDYLRETARTDSLYGLSRVERILMRVNLALRKGQFDLTRFTDGVTPSGVLQTQNQQLFQVTPDELQLWQDMFNGALAGNDQMRVRVKAVPPGWEFKPLTNEQIATELDRWLLNITTGVFGLSMDEIGMTETSNRAVGDSQEKAVYRNAVRPTADFFARYFTRLLRRYDGLPIDPKAATVSRAASPTKPKAGVWDARYMATWKGMEEQEDFNAKVDTGVKLFQSGLYTNVQALRWIGVPVEKGMQEIPAFITPQNGMQQVVVLDDIQDARALAAKSRQQQVDQADAALKQQQMIDQQMSQQQQQGGQEQGDEGDQGNGGENEGDEGPPEPPTPSPPGRGGASQTTPPQGKGKNAPPPEEEPDESEGDDEELPPDQQAQQEVDRLIAQARERQSKGKQQRMQTTETDEDDDADRDFGAPRGIAYEPRGADDTAERREFHGVGSDAVGDADPDGDTAEERGAGSGNNRGSTGSGTASAVAERANTASGNDYDARVNGGSSPSGDGNRGRGSTAERTDEWRNWRAIALKAVRRGEPMPDFVSAVLPSNLHTYAADALQRAVTADDVRQVFADIREAETHPEECRCLVCGCGRPRDDHQEDLPTLQPNAPVTVAPHTDEKQHQLALTACPNCGKSAQDVTDTGYWYTGMVCPQCGHEFTVADERAAMVDEWRTLRADVMRAIEGEVMPPFVTAVKAADEVRWAEHEIVRGANGRIIGNIYPDGHFEPSRGVSHARIRAALALHEVGSAKHTAITNYLSQHTDASKSAKGATPKPLSAQYPGFKTSAEIEAWCQEHVPHIDWRIADLHPDILNEVVPHLLRMGEMFPEPFAMLSKVASADFPDRAVAYATRMSDDTAVIQLSRAYFTNPEKLATTMRENIAAGWYVDSASATDRLRTITHEFGHVVHYWMDASTIALVPSVAYRNFGRIGDITRRWTAFHLATRAVSGYATRNKSEAFAEGFAAIVLAAPRAHATEYVQRMQQLFDRVFRGTRYEHPQVMASAKASLKEPTPELQQLWEELGLDT